MRVAIYCRLSREDDDKLHENDESERQNRAREYPKSKIYAN